MNCPKCSKPLVILELRDVEIDFCCSCRGIWLDNGELELLLDETKEKENLLASFHKIHGTREKKIKCPVCRKKMDKFLVGDEKKVTLDVCVNDDGIWFDRNELYDLLRIGKLDENNKIMSILVDIFNNETLKGEK